MTEYIRSTEGAIEEVDGDVSVPDMPDAYGWQSESRLFDHDFGSEVAAARSILEADTTVSTAEGINDAQEVPVNEKELAERIAEVRERFGFKPTDHQELNDIISLTGKDHIRGSATFLSQVQRRQNRLNEQTAAKNKMLPEDKQIEVDPSMPRRSVESIVGRYIAYAQSAQLQARLLLGLTDMIAAREAKRSEAANSMPILQDWSLDGSTRAPILTLLKSDDVDAFLNQDTPDIHESPLKTRYEDLPGKKLKELGDAYIGSMKIGQFQDTIAQGVSEQRHRFAFWVKTLKDAEINAASSKSVKAGLSKLGIE